jgi:hypothetical protein
MSYKNYTTFKVELKNRVAWVTFDGSVANNRIVSYATGFHVGPS